MDLRTNQEVMGMQSRYPADYGTHIFKVKKTFEETDIKGNNNLFNSLKTEANSNHSHNPDSLFQEKRSNEKKLERDSLLLSYSSFKKAMDLRTHNRTLDGGRRTIFEDAEYFAKNHCYKLLPITFEQVDEVIIQSEHNYSLYSLTSESEAEEDCSRMMDYAQVREKNYKRRRTKFREGSDGEELPESEAAGTHSRPGSGDGKEQVNAPQVLETENSAAVQPLDLSAAPSVQDDKTDEPSPAEHPEGDETVQVDSDKENVNSDTNGIRVTITRPDEKGSYQPCDLFLNDIARLVPWLIDKDCLEVDILDRTCDHRGEFPKHRLYYVISEATWRLFQRTNERVILTNDSSLGQPLRKVEKVERPSYLVFDQLSLAKCLAEYCQEIGGCFEYTCVEEGKEEEEEEQADAVELQEGQRRAVKVKEGEIIEEKMEELVEGKEESKEIPGEEQVHKKTPKEEHREVRKESEGVKKEEEKKKVKEVKEKTEKNKKKEENEENEVKKKKEVEGRYAEEETPEKPGIPAPSSEKQVSFVDGRSEGRGESAGEAGGEEQEGTRKGASSKPKRREGRGVKPKKSFPIQPKPKISRAATARSKSTSESETSQNGDKGVGRKRGGSALPKAEPPRKVKKPPSPEEPRRRTRSGRALEEAKGGGPAAGGSKGERRGRGGGGGTGRTLRSGRVGEGEEGRGRSKRRAGGGGGRGRRCVG